VVATTPSGQTLVIQNANPNQLTNVVVNTANNQNILQDTEVNLVLPGFNVAQQAATLSAMGMRIGADGGFGIISSLPR
jgi:hypothetical protein